MSLKRLRRPRDGTATKPVRRGTRARGGDRVAGDPATAKTTTEDIAAELPLNKFTLDDYSPFLYLFFLFPLMLQAMYDDDDAMSSACSNQFG